MGKLKSLLKAELVSLRVTKKPDPGIWIFSSTDNAHYNYNSRYLFEYVKDNLPKITPYFVINDEKLRKKLGDKYGEQYFIETCSVEGSCLRHRSWEKQDNCKPVAWNPSEKNRTDGP